MICFAAFITVFALLVGVHGDVQTQNVAFQAIWNAAANMNFGGSPCDLAVVACDDAKNIVELCAGRPNSLFVLSHHLVFCFAFARQQASRSLIDATVDINWLAEPPDLSRFAK